MSDSRSVRISDAERSSAIEALGIAFSEGRLDVVEYDTRCQRVAEAHLRGDIDPLFADLPDDLLCRAQASKQTDETRRDPSARRIRADRSTAVVPRPRSAIISHDGTFTAVEIAEAHKAGRNTRLGIFSLASIGSVGSSIWLGAVLGGTLLPASALLLIPVVWVLLYILKVGPDSWYVPSPRYLARMRARQLREEQKAQRLELQAKRSVQWEEFTDNLAGLGRDTVDFGRDYISRHRKQ